MPFFLLLLFSICSFISLSQSVSDSLRLPKTNLAIKSTGRIDSLNSKLNKKLDSLSFSAPGDSASRKSMIEAQSIRAEFQTQVDSLQLHYKKPINKLDSTGKSLQLELNKRTTLKLPTIGATRKLDSVNQVKSKTLAEMNQKMDKLKSKATKSLDSLTLPPQMQGPVQELQQSVAGYNIPVVNGKIPGITASSPKIHGLNLPGNLMGLPANNNSIPGISSTSLNQIPKSEQLNSITGMTGEISNVTGEAGEYRRDLQKITQGNIGEVKNLDKVAEKEAMKNVPAGELSKGTSEMDKYTKQLETRPDSAAIDMIKKEAVNHFAGKEAVLQDAMNSMTKLKKKYSDVKSISELPKKLNPLKSKPFIERLIPGIGLQLLTSNSFMIDLHVGASYRVTPRLSAGAGWLQRLAFQSKANDFRIYGPRANVQFMFSNGFSLRFAPEVVNTYIPPGFYLHPTDGGTREWVWSAFIGIKKEFKVYKKINGYTEGLYNLYNPENKSPYQDRLVVRFGFEFPLKTRIKQDSK